MNLVPLRILVRGRNIDYIEIAFSISAKDEELLTPLLPFRSRRGPRLDSFPRLFRLDNDVKKKKKLRTKSTAYRSKQKKTKRNDL